MRILLIFLLSSTAALAEAPALSPQAAYQLLRDTALDFHGSGEALAPRLPAARLPAPRGYHWTNLPHLAQVPDGSPVLSRTRITAQARARLCRDREKRGVEPGCAPDDRAPWRRDGMHGDRDPSERDRPRGLP